MGFPSTQIEKCEIKTQIKNCEINLVLILDEFEVTTFMGRKGNSTKNVKVQK